MKRIPVICDSCSKKFSVSKSKKKVHKDGLEGTVTIYYITCPHCKKNFVSFVENEEIKKKIQDNKKIHKRLGSIKDDVEYYNMQELFQKNTERIDSMRKDLIFRFSKYVE